MTSPIIVACVVVLLCSTSFAQQGNIEVSPNGRVKTLQQAIELSRQAGGSKKIQIAAGVYRLSEPLTLDTRDSGLEISGEGIVDGSELLDGWAEEKLNGKTVWSRSYTGKPFRALYVNGKPAVRPRYPKIAADSRRNFLGIESVPGMVANGDINQPSDRFIVKPGDFIAKKNLQDVEVVAMQLWIAARFPFAAFDEKTREFRSTHRTPFKLAEGWGEGAVPSRNYMENVFEAFTAPGEWYHDREAQKLYYIPRAGEQLGKVEISAGRASQLLIIAGRPEAPVKGIRITGITLRCTDWYQPSVQGEEVEKKNGYKLATAWQGETHVPGVLEMKYADGVTIQDCTLASLGFAAIRVDDGCSNVMIAGNQIHDLGAGGVQINGGDANSAEHARTSKVTVSDNHIHHGGNMFHAGIGVLSRHASEVKITGNHIHDFYYSGVSVGWVWGYKPSVSRDNLIQGNHIHDIGHGWLSDMAGIYTPSRRTAPHPHRE